MAKVRPSELELQVLGVLWDRGPSPVRAVLEAMPDGKDRAYTTILSVMQVMEKKGLVGHTTPGPAHIYHAKVRRDQVLGPLMRDLLRNAFGGSPARALQCLLEQAELRDGELDEIRRMIDEAGPRPDSEAPAEQEGGDDGHP
jgi:predicted transcriptional regulator